MHIDVAREITKNAISRLAEEQAKVTSIENISEARRPLVLVQIYDTIRKFANLGYFQAMYYPTDQDQATEATLNKAAAVLQSQGYKTHIEYRGLESGFGITIDWRPVFDCDN